MNLDVGSKFWIPVELNRLFSVVELRYGRMHYLCHLFAHVCNSSSSTSANMYKYYYFIVSYIKFRNDFQCSEDRGIDFLYLCKFSKEEIV